MKLNAQLALVARALAGARMRRGTISAGYSQVIPSQPMAKNVLKMNRNMAATIPGPEPPMSLMAAQLTMARTTMEIDMPAAPNSMSWRRPNFSMVKTAIHEAAKYSVPLKAASRRETKEDRPISVS